MQVFILSQNIGAEESERENFHSVGLADNIFIFKILIYLFLIKKIKII